METVITLPDGWTPPEGTLAPLLERENVSWIGLLHYVTDQLKEAGNDTSVLTSFRDQILTGDYSHRVQVAMAFMGEIELEHDQPMLV